MIFPSKISPTTLRPTQKVEYHEIRNYLMILIAPFSIHVFTNILHSRISMQISDLVTPSTIQIVWILEKTLAFYFHISSITIIYPKKTLIFGQYLRNFVIFSTHFYHTGNGHIWKKWTQFFFSHFLDFCLRTLTLCVRLLHHDRCFSIFSTHYHRFWS